MVIAVDPGHKGAIVFYYNKSSAKTFKMPLLKNGKQNEVDYFKLKSIFKPYRNELVYIERAKPMAMGAMSAFNYGADFRSIILAAVETGLTVKFIEPHTWCKHIHEGINKDLKPKAKSDMAVRKYLPMLIKSIPITPRSGVMHDGIVDALLMAYYVRYIM